MSRRDNDGSTAYAAEYLQVPAGLVEAAVAYYGEYRDEIDAEIELNEAEHELRSTESVWV
ncbi:MAG TPA: hypothetical protein VK053_00410 [Jiangellaceae bacterium]|nr:hypothetical protein [Jiangellaceae bacterium]